MLMTAAEKRAEIARTRDRVKELIDSGSPLSTSLDHLVRGIENVLASGMLASILVLDEEGRHLLHGGAPSLPADYNTAINGIEIGPAVGSCGTAAFHNKPVVVFDIANDPLWANFKDLALKHGLRACWSTPIRSADGRVLGTFANYYPVVRDPSPIDRELTDMITRTAATAIERDRRRRPQAVTAST